MPIAAGFGQREALVFERADVTGRRPRHTALVFAARAIGGIANCRRAGDCVARVNGRGTGQESDGLSGAAIIAQAGSQRIDRRCVRPGDIAVDAVGDARTAVCTADQVVSIGDENAAQVRPIGRRGIACHKRVDQPDNTCKFVNTGTAIRVMTHIVTYFWRDGCYFYADTASAHAICGAGTGCAVAAYGGVDQSDRPAIDHHPAAAVI